MCGYPIKPVKISDMEDAKKVRDRIMRYLRFHQKMALVWNLMFCASVAAPFLVIAIFAMRFINA
ncbi:hypothetical protein [Phytobacter sp. MRY16-398]|uniref:hypothetical protein n=1 Tax=Phytobacter sp. MRY16-398 TaxID=2487150 RepID=UPI000F63B236|nr:hypothetical protein [Phytobacter sp. MRY16-398]